MRERAWSAANENDTAVHYLSINSPDLVMILVRPPVRTPAPPRTAPPIRPPRRRGTARLCVHVPFQSLSVILVISVDSHL